MVPAADRNRLLPPAPFPAVTDRVPAGDERVRFRGDRVAVVERPMAGADGVERVECARRAPGVRHLVVGDDGLLLVPDGPQGPGEPTWRLPGGPAFDSYPGYAAVRHGDADEGAAVDDAAGRVLRVRVGLEPVEPERLAVLAAGPGVEFDLYYYLVERHRPAPRDGDPSDATWAALDDARAAALDGRLSEPRSALAVLQWLAD